MIRAKVLGRKYSTYNLDLGSLRHLFLPIVSAHCYCASKSTPHVHCLPQRPRSFWSAPRIATLGADQRERGIWKRECENIGPPFDLYMLRVQRHVSILFCFCSFELSKQPITLVNQTYCSQACVVRKEDSRNKIGGLTGRLSHAQCIAKKLTFCLNFFYKMIFALTSHS